MNTTVSSKGRITVPRFLCEALGLKPGSLVSLSLDDGELRLRPAPPAGTARRLAGSLRRYAKADRTKTIRARVKRQMGRAAAHEGI